MFLFLAKSSAKLLSPRWQSLNKINLDVSLNEKNSLFPDVTGKGIYQSMYNDTLSNQFGGKFGFSQILFDYLKENR